MAKAGSKADQGNSTVPERTPRSLAIAQRGIGTSRDFAQYMSALMCDVVEGRLNPGVCNAAVNAGGKLLKCAEMELKYGQTGVGSGEKVLNLAAAPLREIEPVQ